MPRIRMESGPRGVDHITIPQEKMRESGWQVGDEVTFNWDGKRMILTKLPEAPAAAKIPAKVETTATVTDAQEMDAQEIKKTADIMPAPAMKERPQAPNGVGPRSTQDLRRCPTCDTMNHGIRTTCHVCGAALVTRLGEKARDELEIWRQMNQDPAGR